MRAGMEIDIVISTGNTIIGRRVEIIPETDTPKSDVAQHGINLVRDEIVRMLRANDRPIPDPAAGKRSEDPNRGL